MSWFEYFWQTDLVLVLMLVHISFFIPKDTLCYTCGRARGSVCVCVFIDTFHLQAYDGDILIFKLKVTSNLSNNDTCFITSSDVGQRKYNCVISAKISELHLNYQKIAWFVWGSSNRESVTEISAQLLKYSCILYMYRCTCVCMYLHVCILSRVCLFVSMLRGTFTFASADWPSVLGLGSAVTSHVQLAQIHWKMFNVSVRYTLRDVVDADVVLALAQCACYNLRLLQPNELFT